MTDAQVLILPGWANSGPEHWQSLWEREHPEYRRVEQRDWDEPVLAEWEANLEAAVTAATSPVVLVAHSLGCVLAAQWAPRAAGRVRGALLVAPPDADHPEWPDAITGFAPMPMRRLPFPSVLVASTDDPYAAIARSRAFAAAWGSRFVVLDGAGHINSVAGYGPWPEGERLLAELLRG